MRCMVPIWIALLLPGPGAAGSDPDWALPHTRLRTAEATLASGDRQQALEILHEAIGGPRPARVHVAARIWFRIGQIRFRQGETPAALDAIAHMAIGADGSISRGFHLPDDVGPGLLRWLAQTERVPDELRVRALDRLGRTMTDPSAARQTEGFFLQIVTATDSTAVADAALARAAAWVKARDGHLAQIGAHLEQLAAEAGSGQARDRIEARAAALVRRLSQIPPPTVGSRAESHASTLEMIDRALPAAGRSENARRETIEAVRDRGLDREIKRLLRRRRNQEAIAHCREVAAAEPGTALARTAVRRLLSMTRGVGTVAVAQTLDRFMAYFPQGDPNHEYACLQAAIHCYDESHFERAIEMVDRFGTRFPDSRSLTDALIVKSQALIGLGDYEGAMPPLKEALAADRASAQAPKALFLTAWIHLQLDERRAWIRGLKQIVERYPDSRFAAEARRQLQQTREQAPAE